MRAIISYDPFEHETLRTNLFRTGINPDSSRLLAQLITRMRESHLIQTSSDVIGKTSGRILASQMSLGTDVSQIDSFISSKIQIPEPVIITPDVFYYKNLLCLVVILYSIAFVIFLIELYYVHLNMLSRRLFAVLVQVIHYCYSSLFFRKLSLYLSFLIVVFYLIVGEVLYVRLTNLK